MSTSFGSSDYAVGRFSAQCAGCGKALEAGQVYYAVIRLRGGEYVREDYDEGCWREPEEQPVGVWRARVAAPSVEAKPRRVASSVLMDVFEKLGDVEHDSGAKLRFLLALLLMRRRKMRHEQTRAEGGEQKWVLRRAGDGAEFVIAAPALSQEDQDVLSRQLMDLLVGLDSSSQESGDRSQ